MKKLSNTRVQDDSAAHLLANDESPEINLNRSSTPQLLDGPNIEMDPDSPPLEEIHSIEGPRHIYEADTPYLEQPLYPIPMYPVAGPNMDMDSIFVESPETEAIKRAYIKYGGYVVNPPISTYPSAATLPRDENSCSCYDGCDDDYHATLCRCRSIKCKYLDAIPNTLFETHPNWKYNTRDHAAGCCRCVSWNLCWASSILFATLAYTPLLCCLVIGGDHGGGFDCQDKDYKPALGDEDIKKKGCCDHNYTKWATSQVHTSWNIFSCWSPPVSYDDHMRRGDLHVYSNKKGLEVPSITVLQDPHFYQDTLGTKKNILCGYRWMSCCVCGNICPCAFTGFMSPEF